MDDLALYDSMLRDLRWLMGPFRPFASPRHPGPAQGFVELEIEWLEESPSAQASSC